jgi:hypothetical protein
MAASFRTLDAMRSLPGSRKVAARREGRRLVIEETADQPLPARWRQGVPRVVRTPMRYAAGLLIAFTAGYGLHAGLTLAKATRAPTVAESPSAAGETSLEGSLVRAHTRNPGRSGLAKCLIAMSSGGR